MKYATKLVVVPRHAGEEKVKPQNKVEHPEAPRPLNKYDQSHTETSFDEHTIGSKTKKPFEMKKHITLPSNGNGLVDVWINKSFF